MLFSPPSAIKIFVFSVSLSNSHNYDFCHQALLNVLDQCPKIEVDIPLVKSYLAQFAARAVIAELVSVAELAHPLENGNHFPLFLLCLQQASKLKDREWLTDLFQQSKVNMQKMLPGMSPSDTRAVAIRRF